MKCYSVIKGFEVYIESVSGSGCHSSSARKITIYRQGDYKEFVYQGDKQGSLTDQVSAWRYARKVIESLTNLTDATIKRRYRYYLSVPYTVELLPDRVAYKTTIFQNARKGRNHSNIKFLEMQPREYTLSLQGEHDWAKNTIDH